MFELPRSIARELKRCVESHGIETGPANEAIEYLWINVSNQGMPRREDLEPERGPMSLEKWLNVVDEASSLGVHCLLVCAGECLSDHPDIWPICQWAQDAYGMMVGIHTRSRGFGEDEIRHLRALDLRRMCLFVAADCVEKLRYLTEDYGIGLCVADVGEEERSGPCTMPECMVFVGPEGRVYTCGLVFGERNYCLGSVLDRRLSQIVDDQSLPHVVVDHPKGCSCDACPPIMARRVMGAKR
ncbi:MAG TPA: hypothetical protein PLO37_13800 [Candidatus Hydrogenedentes bacterium]|nr:hypothetical protein [Candidatus Hydrogenedentota bacterium]HPG67918.1 hypothetical protein [Candidatus Hydrogenedentota bacterium]